MATFRLTSLAFADGGAIPTRYTCDGEDVSPALAWEGAPDATAALALLVDDPDANGFVHWVVFNLTGSSSGALPEAVSASPDAPPQGRNGFGRVGYGGPCPPSSSHRYRFTLFALSEPLELAGQPAGRELEDAVSASLLARTQLIGPYTRRR
jgi:Raf kinase inhibitor-like YbhB/YbcL family protein